jgi:hypothetical protein
MTPVRQKYAAAPVYLLEADAALAVHLTINDVEIEAPSVA